jgi:hypothetical protein
VGVGLLAVAFGAAVAMLRLGRRAAVTGMVAALASGGVGASGGLARATCYIMAPLFYRRDSQMLVQQKELLDKFRERGVLTEETYRKLVSAMEPPAPNESTEAEKRDQ